MLHRIHILNNNHEKTFSPERTNIAKPSHDALKKKPQTPLTDRLRSRVDDEAV